MVKPADWARAEGEAATSAMARIAASVPTRRRWGFAAAGAAADEAVLLLQRRDDGVVPQRLMSCAVGRRMGCMIEPDLRRSPLCHSGAVPPGRMVSQHDGTAAGEAAADEGIRALTWLGEASHWPDAAQACCSIAAGPDSKCSWFTP